MRFLSIDVLFLWVVAIVGVIIIVWVASALQ
jgi:hypothetical protein